MLYHYTTIEAASSIASQGMILTGNLQLFLDLGCQVPGPLVGPFVWMTRSIDPEPTIINRSIADNMRAGLSANTPFDLVRVTIDPEMVGHRVYNLDQLIQKLGLNRTAFRWVIATAMAAGANPADWRIAMQSIDKKAIASYDRVPCAYQVGMFVSRMNRVQAACSGV